MQSLLATTEASIAETTFYGPLSLDGVRPLCNHTILNLLPLDLEVRGSVTINLNVTPLRGDLVPKSQLVLSTAGDKTGVAICQTHGPAR